MPRAKRPLEGEFCYPTAKEVVMGSTIEDVPRGRGKKKLTMDDARVIRGMMGQRSAESLAREWGVSRNTIQEIWKGRRYSENLKTVREQERALNAFANALRNVLDLDPIYDVRGREKATMNEELARFYKGEYPASGRGDGPVGRRRSGAW